MCLMAKSKFNERLVLCVKARKVRDLVKGLDHKVLKGNIDTEVSDVVFDSRKATKDTIFVCIIGAVSDGHDYIKKAYDAGCRAFVIEKDVKNFDEDNESLVIKTDNNRRALAVLSQAIFEHPGNDLTTIAITGTKGKTTTSFMIRDILTQHGKNVGIIGTTGVYIKDKYIEIHNTTPESYDIQKFFRMMVEDGCDTCVMEVSSQALKLDRTYGIEFDYGIFTNLAPDHIGENEHKDYAEYRHCKSILFTQCKHGIFNLDDKETDEMTKNATCDIYTYGFDEDSSLYAENLEYVMKPGMIGISFDSHGAVEGNIVVATPGKFSAYNAMAAILVSSLIGVDIEDIKKALLKTFVKGRVEQVKVSDRFTLMIDYAHNAMSMESLLSTIREYKPKRIVSLFGCGGNRSKLRRYEMGEVSGRLADFSIVTADNSRFENVNDIIDDILVGMKKTDGKYIVIPDRKEAIKYSIENAKDGDIVLLLGKGHEDYQEIEGVRYPFDERVIIAEIMEELGGKI